MPNFNFEAEKSILGCLMIEKELIRECLLRPEHFYDSKHELIFRFMTELDKKEKPIDLVHLSAELGSHLQEVGDILYLSELMNSVPYAANAKYYETLVRDAWKMRESVRIANKLREDAESSTEIGVIEQAIMQLSRLHEQGYDSDFDLSKTLMEVYEEMAADTGEMNGVSTGYQMLNNFTNGWQDGDMIVVGARPSVGKTAFALNMAVGACDSGTVTTIFSLEMSNKSLLKRILSQVGSIDATKMRNPNRYFKDDPKFWGHLTNTIVSIIEKNQLYIFDKPSVTVQEMRAKMRAVMRKHPDKKHLCIIDYLQLIQGSGKENRVQEVAEISRGLKLMARELNIPVIVLSQLSRDVEKRGGKKKPTLSDLRESGAIEQDADIVILLYRDDYYEEESEKPNTIEIIIAKQRNGPVGSVELSFIKKFNKFYDLSQRSDEPVASHR